MYSPASFNIDELDIHTITKSDLKSIAGTAEAAYQKQEELNGKSPCGKSSGITRVVDRKWMDHIDAMDRPARYWTSSLRSAGSGYGTSLKAMKCFRT